MVKQKSDQAVKQGRNYLCISRVDTTTSVCDSSQVPLSYIIRRLCVCVGLLVSKSRMKRNLSLAQTCEIHTTDPWLQQKLWLKSYTK